MSVFVVDLFNSIVTATGTALSPAVKLHYTYGPFKEIVHKLAVMAQAESTTNPRYPLIALLTDFQETKGENLQIYSEVKLRVLIANLTMNNYIAEERTLLSFKPVLYPIYEQLLIQIHKSHKFDTNSEAEIPHTKYDRYNFGRTQAFVDDGNGTDFIDAIEITSLSLKIKTPVGCKLAVAETE